jgi:antitoxin component YwqK of YwqJK toxin-antitoxin module
MLIFLVLLALLCGCASKAEDPNQIVSLQIIDRNGFSETISTKDRLANYEKTDFLASQPYQKVLRVFGKSRASKAPAIITSYHPNSQLWQYLETVNGRALGIYREWHPNSQLRLETSVIEGTADITPMAQMSWVFDGQSRVWDEEGNLMAEIRYEKGVLEGPALYYHPNGKISQTIPYHKDVIEGTLTICDDQGAVIEKIPYKKGAKEGQAFGPHYQETYTSGLLIQAAYTDTSGQVVSTIEKGFGKQAIFKNQRLQSKVEYKKGVAEGEIELFNEEGCLISSYTQVDSKKHGDEWEYYPQKEGTPRPKLCIHWDQDAIQGTVKTWYATGVLESQREMHGNKKHGLSFAWFKEGDLMLMEEYENNTLIKGSYFKKWEKKPVSRVENGKGTATLFDSSGRLLKKIAYDKGIPLGE